MSGMFFAFEESGWRGWGRGGSWRSREAWLCLDWVGVLEVWGMTMMMGERFVRGVWGLREVVR